MSYCFARSAHSPWNSISAIHPIIALLALHDHIQRTAFMYEHQLIIFR